MEHEKFWEENRRIFTDWGPAMRHEFVGAGSSPEK